MVVRADREERGPDVTAGLTGPARAQPTLEEVAARAGVSRATVSRVINDSPRVSEVARAQVLAAIGELGYVPNRAARSLVTRRSNSIALIIAEPGTRLFSDPYFAGIVRGVSQGLAPTDEQLVLLMRQSADDLPRMERYLQNGHVDGVLMVSLHGDDDLPVRLQQRGVPVVVGGRPLVGGDVAYVDADNSGGAHRAVTHLIASGRTHIATITGPLDMGVGVDRRDGYRTAIVEAGAEVDPRYITEGDFGEDSGYEATRVLLHRVPEIDAIFAASDLMAVGALRALTEAGKAVPDDVALIGFDDSVAARTADPPLSTVRQPVARMGREMTRLLLDLIAGVPRNPHMVLDTELVLRRSA
jgi:DNA-binding LacI/PurR family transcriptional regulator